MASTQRGSAVLKFGTIALPTYVVQATDLDKTMESVEVQDEDGQFLTEVETFGLQDGLQLTLIPLSAATEPALGTTITYNLIKYSLKQFKRVNNNKQVEMWTLTLRRLIGITYT
jgi:hypothetical protein